MFVKRKVYQEENIYMQSSLVWGKCSKQCVRLKTTSKYEKASEQIGAIELLKIIRSQASNFQGNKHPVDSLHYTFQHILRRF